MKWILLAALFVVLPVQADEYGACIADKLLAERAHEKFDRVCVKPTPAQAAQDQATAEARARAVAAARSKCRVQAMQAAGPRPTAPNLKGVGGFQRGWNISQYAKDLDSWKALRQSVFSDCMIGEGF